MSAQVIAFPKRKDEDTDRHAGDRAADEHLLAAMAHSERLDANGAYSKTYVDFRCVHAGLDGLAQFIRQANPGLTDAGVAEFLSTTLTFYRRRSLGLAE